MAAYDATARQSVARTSPARIDGWTEEAILKNYSGLIREDIQACLRYASARLQAEKVYPLNA